MRLRTDRPEFYNDICEEIRLFLPKTTIELVDIDADSSDDDGFMTAYLSVGERFSAAVTYSVGGRVYSYRHSSPYRGGSELVEKRYAKRCIKVAVFRTMQSAYPDRLIPWGSLTGIRPTRLFRELNATEGREEAIRLMSREFDVSSDKISLANTICNVQKPIIESAGPNEFDVYVGIPFCRTRCLYCSFASELRTKKTDMAAYLSAVLEDIRLGAAMSKRMNMLPRAFYIGGGTPTILNEDELRMLLDHLVSMYEISGQEFTVEAGRPDTITLEKLKIMREYGVNRISVNPQTMRDATLKLVGRDHTAKDMIVCYEMARQVGFDCINIDLIAGLPNENVSDMEHTLSEVMRLDPECLTVHTLAIKRSSRLHEHIERYELPDVSTVERMTALGAAAAEKLGMVPYYMYRQKYMAGNLENVGYSKPGNICVYNIDMMEDSLSIIAHGAGSMTKRVFDEGGRIERVPNPKDIATYIAKLAVTQNEREKLFAF